MESMTLRRARLAPAVLAVLAAAALAACGDDAAHKPAACPTGRLERYSPCGGFGRAFSADSIGPDEGCFVYDYDGRDTLLLTHVNAAFNCCPTRLVGIVTFPGDTIRVKESEIPEGGVCDCSCLYDLDFRITGLPPGIYHVVFDEPYVSPPDAPLTATIDLSTAASDTVCVARTRYPWHER
jgi:hypothetical protein